MSGFVEFQDCFLQQDNVPAHKSISMQQFLDKYDAANFDELA